MSESGGILLKSYFFLLSLSLQHLTTPENHFHIGPTGFIRHSQTEQSRVQREAKQDRDVMKDMLSVLQSSRSNTNSAEDYKRQTEIQDHTPIESEETMFITRTSKFKDMDLAKYSGFLMKTKPGQMRYRLKLFIFTFSLSYEDVANLLHAFIISR